MLSTKSSKENYDAKTVVTTRVLKGFDDPSFSREQWMQLLEKGETDVINLTWHWQRSWWNAFGKGELLLVLAERNEKAVALAPMFSIGGMIYNICPEDCLDFIGDVSDPAILDAILNEAKRNVTGFLGFLFYFIPEHSLSGKRLREAALRLGLAFQNEGQIPSPWIDLKGQPEKAEALTRKKSLRRHENYFRQAGEVNVMHFQKANDIQPHLESFFKQHIKRRALTSAPSIFQHQQQKRYYQQLSRDMESTGWLRFTVVYWKGQPIAYHYGLSYKGRYLFGIPSFAIELASHSPGEVLIRQLLLAAIDEGATAFDFGIGDEPYKYRFATNTTILHHYGLYPL